MNLIKKYGSIIPSPSWRDRDNGVVADPLLLRWDGCRWEPRRAVNTEEMNAVEARIPLKQGECQVALEWSMSSLKLQDPRKMRSGGAPDGSG
ncbi:MAG: hypothetical protein BA066_04505 [Candidatus Korarchaeota archaeon NZ13-K]|nr:MAG: hypothetical protein BA066_04505 [Candidatus Korarchaeota archaeon NZ13-K]